MSFSIGTDPHQAPEHATKTGKTNAIAQSMRWDTAWFNPHHYLSESLMRSNLSSIAPEAGATASYDAGAAPFPKVPVDELFNAIINADHDGLSLILEQGLVDLTTISDATGQTPLHTAIASGHGDIVRILLSVADHDPLVINALDRDGYTPLMLAAALDDVPLMQHLIHAGAATDNNITDYRDPHPNPSRNDRAAIKAMVLLAARGDKTVALQLAVENHKYSVAELFSRAGANGEQALQHFVEQRDRHGMHAMIDRQYADANDVERVLDRAVQSGDEHATSMLVNENAPATKLLMQYTELGDIAGLKALVKAKAFSDQAFENILDASNLTKAQKMKIFSTMLKAGAKLDGLLDKLGKRNNVEAQRLLIIAGAPAVHMLMDLARAGRRDAAQTFIRIGADVAKAIDELLLNGEQTAAHVLTVAMAQAVLEDPRASGSPAALASSV